MGWDGGSLPPIALPLPIPSSARCGLPCGPSFPPHSPKCGGAPRGQPGFAHFPSRHVWLNDSGASARASDCVRGGTWSAGPSFSPEWDREAGWWQRHPKLDAWQERGSWPLRYPTVGSDLHPNDGSALQWSPNQWAFGDRSVPPPGHGEPGPPSGRWSSSSWSWSPSERYNREW